MIGAVAPTWDIMPTFIGGASFFSRFSELARQQKIEIRALWSRLAVAALRASQ
ncbi:MAG: hypothetical protein LBM75_08520 [Myxococcales bacterium]|jgi:hypothetical protein|nr:hypothetical protein [Myxococcales bacterium]